MRRRTFDWLDIVCAFGVWAACIVFLGLMVGAMYRMFMFGFGLLT